MGIGGSDVFEEVVNGICPLLWQIAGNAPSGGLVAWTMRLEVLWSCT